MAAVTIRLSAPAQWHALALAARASWPPLVLLDLVSSVTDDDDSALVTAQATEAVPPASTSLPPRAGVARALIIGASPMSAESFTVWAQRALLGTANPAIDGVLSWTLPHAVTEVLLPGDARASHYARTAMRSIGEGLACIDDVLLATSELTANALQHGAGAPRLTAIRREGSVTVALTDGRPEVVPVVQRLRGASASSGRGMAIIDAISNHWGITVYHDRKVVWCEIVDDADIQTPAPAP